MRLAVLETTRAMLDQKRRAWIRGVALSYTVEGKRLTPDPALLEQLEREAADAERQVAEAQSKADLYAGGLVHGLALAEVQTRRVTAAVIRQRMALAWTGLGVPVTADQPPPPPIGQALGDEGAL